MQVSRSKWNIYAQRKQNLDNNRCALNRDKFPLIDIIKSVSMLKITSYEIDPKN